MEPTVFIMYVRVDNLESSLPSEVLKFEDYTKLDATTLYAEDCSKTQTQL